MASKSLNGIFGRAVARVIYGGTTVDTTGGNALYISGTYRRGLGGMGVYTHVLRFATLTAYQAAITTLSTSRRLTFQSGLDTGGSVQWSPTQTQAVIRYSAAAGSGNSGSPSYTLTITCGNLLHAASLRSRTKAWTGTADAILSAVATAAGLTPSSEPALGGTMTILQCGVNDLAFMVRVVNDYYLGQIASDTIFAVQEDQFLAGSTGWSGWPTYTLAYPGRGVSNLEHLDRGGEATGTRQVLGVRYDPLTGIITQMMDNPSTLTALANQPLPGDPASILEGGFHNAPTAPENSWWKQQYSDAAILQSGVAVTVTGPDRIQPGALLTLNTGLSTDPMAGTYQIAHAYTEIIGGQATTRLEMRRAQINVAGAGAPQGVSPSTSTGSASVGAGGAVIPIQSGGG